MDLLPAEVITFIAEYLHDDRRAIARWALCGRAYFHRLLPHIYHNLEVTDRYPLRRRPGLNRDAASPNTKISWQGLVRFLPLLLNRPDIAQMIRSLRVPSMRTITYTTDMWRSWFVGEKHLLQGLGSALTARIRDITDSYADVAQAEQTWFSSLLNGPRFDDAWLALLLTRLHHLECIDIEIDADFRMDFHVYEGRDMSWTWLVLSSMPSGRTKMKSPTHLLKKMVLGQAAFFWQPHLEVLSFPSLTSLELRGCRFGIDLDELAYLLSMRAPLHTLVLVFDAAWNSNEIRYPINVSSDLLDISALFQSLQPLHDKLKTLTIALGPGARAAMQGGTLKSLTTFHALERLHISHEIIIQVGLHSLPRMLKELRILRLKNLSRMDLAFLLSEQSRFLPFVEHFAIEADGIEGGRDGLQPPDRILHPGTHLVVWMRLPRAVKPPSPVVWEVTSGAPTTSDHDDRFHCVFASS
ncbi:hypothetical protein CAC42_541 [Sphaceloma murrayae]|uniref:F-box domain-containing protein n=1 Tax=Sphaceloma murrayae TaxID=2082308 RepID=A0A2K1R418_9PEZI|nr:hypothetical protein CAC42_541 [Sphaceloma murrayae]